MTTRKVFETKFVLTVYTDSISGAPDLASTVQFLDNMSLAELDHLISEDHGIGTWDHVETTEVPEDQIVARMEAIGNDGSFFDMEALGIEDDYEDGGR